MLRGVQEDEWESGSRMKEEGDKIRGASHQVTMAYAYICKCCAQATRWMHRRNLWSVTAPMRRSTTNSTFSNLPQKNIEIKDECENWIYKAWTFTSSIHSAYPKIYYKPSWKYFRHLYPKLNEIIQSILTKYFILFVFS